MQTLILTPDDFAAAGIDLPAGIEPRLNPHVGKAQEMRLRPALGAPLFNELLRRYATKDVSGEGNEWASPWPALRDVCAPLVVAAAWGRYLPLGQLTVTTHSVVVKDARDSKPADAQQIREAIKLMADDATRYESELRSYLGTTQVAADFALWLPATGCGYPASGNQSSTRTRPLRRPGCPPTTHRW